MIYVGITRAKKALRIHYSDCDLFDGMDVDGIEKSACDSIPRRLSDVIVQLSHKDVVLDFFLDKKSVVVGLRSGDALKVDGNYLVSSVGGRMVRVAKFSQSFIQKLSELADKGYRPQFAMVRYIVAWRKNEEETETAIILPDLHLSSV